MKIYKYILPFLILILFLIIMTEAYFKTFDNQPIFENYTIPKFGNHTAFRKNQKINKNLKGFTYTVKTDDKNLRNFRETTYKKPKGLFRILCIGGSIFEAMGVNNDETIAAQLDKILQGQKSEQKFEVINAAKASWELPEFESFFRNEGYKYNPDLVIIYFHTGELMTMQTWKYEAKKINFTRISNHSVLIEVSELEFNNGLNIFTSSSLRFMQNFPLYDFLFKKLQLIRFLENKLRNNLINKSKKIKSNSKFVQSMKLWDLKAEDNIDWKTDYGEIKNTSVGQIGAVLYSIGLENFYRKLKRKNVQLLFLHVPSFQEILKVEDLSKRVKPFPVINPPIFGWLNLTKLLTQFQNNNLIELNYPEVIHWTPAGHKLSAIFIFNYLVENNLILGSDRLKKLKITKKIIKLISNSNQRIEGLFKKQKYRSFLKGIIFKNNGQLKKAEDNFLQYLEKYPNSLRAKIALGFTYYQDKKFKRGKKVFQSVLKKLTNEDKLKNPFSKSIEKEIKYYISISSLFDSFWHEFNNKNYTKSLEFLIKAESLNGKYDLDKIYDNFATVYYRLRDFQKAEKNWLKATYLKPEFFGYYQNLGNLFFDQKRFNEAVIFYKKAIRYGPANDKISTMLGLSYLFLNKIESAKNELRSALKDNPKNQIAIGALKKIEEVHH